MMNKYTQFSVVISVYRSGISILQRTVMCMYMSIMLAIVEILV